MCKLLKLEIIDAWDNKTAQNCLSLKIVKGSNGTTQSRISTEIECTKKMNYLCKKNKKRCLPDPGKIFLVIYFKIFLIKYFPQELRVKFQER